MCDPALASLGGRCYLVAVAAPRTLSLPSRCALVLVLGCAACSASAGGQTGGEEPPGADCSKDQITLGPSELSSDGFSAAQVLSALPPGSALPFVYDSGEATTLTAAVSYTGPTTYSRTCQRLELGVSLAFATADGAYQERIPSTLTAMQLNAAHVAVGLEQRALQGSAKSAELFTPSAGTTVHFDVAFEPGGLHGDVAAYAPRGALGETVLILARF